MKHKRDSSTKKSGTFEGKSNKLGHGGRAAQLKAKGVPGTVIGMIARSKGAAMGQANYHGKKRKRMTVAEDKAMDKKMGIKEGSKKDIAMDKKHGVKDRKYKRSSGTPSGSKNPFGTIKTDKLAGAGKTMYPNILSKTSPQNKLDTGKSLLAKAMRKMRKHG